MVAEIVGKSKYQWLSMAAFALYIIHSLE